MVPKKRDTLWRGIANGTAALIIAALVTACGTGSAPNRSDNSALYAAIKSFSDKESMQMIADRIASLGLNRGRVITLQSGRIAEVVRLNFAAWENSLTPVLELYEPSFFAGFDQKDPDPAREARARSDHMGVCKEYGAQLQDLTNDLFPDLSAERVAVMFRDKRSHMDPRNENYQKVQNVIKFGTVFTVENDICIENKEKLEGSK